MRLACCSRAAGCLLSFPWAGMGMWDRIISIVINIGNPDLVCEKKMIGLAVIVSRI